jgi:hypothetical protein
MGTAFAVSLKANNGEGFSPEVYARSVVCFPVRKWTSLDELLRE